MSMEWRIFMDADHQDVSWVGFCVFSHPTSIPVLLKPYLDLPLGSLPGHQSVAEGGFLAQAWSVWPLCPPGHRGPFQEWAHDWTKANENFQKLLERDPMFSPLGLDMKRWRGWSCCSHLAAMRMEPVWEGTHCGSKRRPCRSKDVICVLIQATRSIPPWNFQFCEINEFPFFLKIYNQVNT